VTIGHDDVAIELEAVQVGRAAGVGRVVAAGDRAGELLDRRVLVGPIDPCGECEVCRRGGGPVCPLARRRDQLAARTTAAARWLVALDDGLDLPVPAAAAVAGDVALAYTLYARTGAGPREPVIVVGASPIARFLIEILVAKNLAPLAVATPGGWDDWLRARGVATAPDRPGLEEALRARSLGNRLWRLICADPAATSTAVELAGPRSTLTLLAAAAPPDLAGAVLAREVTILGVAGAHPDLVVEAAAMCAKGEIDLTAGTTEVAPDAAPATGGAASSSAAHDPPRTHVRTLR
jgi:threonine dehydrogenase-like Zn-dependent dehydrogenase